MNNREQHDIKRLVQRTDRAIHLDANELAIRVLEKKRIRTLATRLMIVCAVAFGFCGTLLIWSQSENQNQNSRIAQTDETNIESETFEIDDFDLEDLLPRVSNTLDLDESLARLKELKLDLAELSETRQRQELLVLKEQLSRQNLNTIANYHSEY